TATEVAGALQAHVWDRLNPVLAARNETGPRGEGARGILQQLRENLLAEEFQVPLAAALAQSEGEIFGWLSARPPAPPAPSPPPPPAAAGSFQLRPGQPAREVLPSLPP